MPRINKRLVDALRRDPERRRILWDDKLPGFGVVIQTSGTASFVYDYRTPEGRKRRAKIARVGTLTPEQARDAAENMAKRVAAGGDPLGDKQARQHALTLADLFDRYLASAKFAANAESTRAIDVGRIKRHLKPLLGKVYVDKLTAEGVRRAHADIRDGKDGFGREDRTEG